MCSIVFGPFFLYNNHNVISCKRFEKSLILCMSTYDTHMMRCIPDDAFMNAKSAVVHKEEAGTYIVRGGWSRAKFLI